MIGSQGTKVLLKSNLFFLRLFFFSFFKAIPSPHSYTLFPNLIASSLQNGEREGIYFFFFSLFSYLRTIRYLDLNLKYY